MPVRAPYEDGAGLNHRTKDSVEAGATVAGTVAGKKAPELVRTESIRRSAIPVGFEMKRDTLALYQTVTFPKCSESELTVIDARLASTVMMCERRPLGSDSAPPVGLDSATNRFEMDTATTES